MASKDPMLVQLGRFLRAAREDAGWSQEEMAFECGLHRTYIGAVERGEYNITLKTLRTICDVLEVTMGDAIASISPRNTRR